MANAKYFLKRFAMALLTIFLVACLTFLLMNAVPGSPWLSEENAICRNPGSAECKIWPG